jgi:Fe-S cluster assembly ATP-binding protein
MGLREAGAVIELRDLTVSVGGTCILRGVHMDVRAGETVALFGPNGSGKTTLLFSIMGFPGYEVESGSIRFKGEDITGLPLDERARRGIGMSFQRPPAVRGVRLRDVMAACLVRRGMDDGAFIEEAAESLALKGFLGRDLNRGFSGGEIKRSELLQLRAQEPDFVMFDEPDSGVDLVSITQVGRVMNELLQKERPAGRRTKAGLIISHAGHILEYVNADRAYVMLGGRLYCSGNPRDILEDIRERGYEGCIACLKQA